MREVVGSIPTATTTFSLYLEKNPDNYRVEESRMNGDRRESMVRLKGANRLFERVERAIVELFTDLRTGR